MVTAFVGTYTDGDGDGVYHLDVSAGEPPTLRRTGATPIGDDPSFLAVHPSEDVLYTVHEVPEGGVSAHEIRRNDGATPSLSGLGRTASGAGGPCHCSVHPSGEFLFVAHYTGGAVSVLPIGADGVPDEPSDVVRHAGSSRHPDRQTEAHPHSITPGPTGRYVYVPDLGTDEIVVYGFDPGGGKLERVSTVTAAPGAGPRHMAFHPDLPVAYVINELGSTVRAYERDERTGELTGIDGLSTLPGGFDGDNLAADIHVHPSGDRVYGSNRGHDSIAVFGVGDDGTLRFLEAVSTRGASPRTFALDPTGATLFAGNRHSDAVVGFRVNRRTGDLEWTGATASVPRPACLRFVPDRL